LSVQPGAGDPVDLTLSCTAPLAALLPDIVALTRVEPGGWRLSRTDGRDLDESNSLRQNMIEDGDLLILSRDELPPLPPRPFDAFELAAATDAPSIGAPSAIPRLAFVWAVVVTCTVTCARGGFLGGSMSAALACAGCLAAIRPTRRAEPASVMTLCCAAIVFGASAGFLAVPSSPSAPNVMLATVAASAVAWLVVRLHAEALVLGAGTVSLCAPLVLTAVPAIVRSLPAEALGAGISALALTTLSFAPRLAVLIAGLAPDTTEVERTRRAHRMVTGVILGSSVAVALGAALLAVDGQHRGAPVLGLLLAAAMALRASSYPDPTRQWAVSIGGLLCATSAFLCALRAFPHSAPWVSLAILAAAFTALHTGSPTAAVHRALTRVELVTSVAVVPTALWVAGVYSLALGR
jgi:type VII secretion integral membrane protein EccD